MLTRLVNKWIYNVEHESCMLHAAFAHWTYDGFLQLLYVQELSRQVWILYVLCLLYTHIHPQVLSTKAGINMCAHCHKDRIRGGHHQLASSDTKKCLAYRPNCSPGKRKDKRLDACDIFPGAFYRDRRSTMGRGGCCMERLGCCDLGAMAVTAVEWQAAITIIVGSSCCFFIKDTIVIFIIILTKEK